jgi:hypothetical protein
VRLVLRYGVPQGRTLASNDRSRLAASGRASGKLVVERRLSSHSGLLQERVALAVRQAISSFNAQAVASSCDQSSA